MTRRRFALAGVLATSLLGSSLACVPVIEDGAFQCDPGQPESCPAGYLCLRRAGEAGHRCLASADDFCGDGRLGALEDCDGASRGPETCRDLGTFGGELGCGEVCRYDTTGCRRLQTLSSALSRVCGIDDAGQGWCWGSRLGRRAMTGKRAEDHRPRRLSAPGQRLARVDTGDAHACALDADGAAWCAGDNTFGQLGSGAAVGLEIDGLQPVFSDRRFDAIATGDDHTCALDVEGSAWCWGANDFGQLGDGSHTSITIPVAVEGDLRFTHLVAAGQVTCGLDATGQAFCWGANENGQLGLGHSDPTPTPRPVATTARFTWIDHGATHGCGLDDAGTVHCWGINDSGQVGADLPRTVAQPTPVQADQRFADLSLGTLMSCGRTLAGETRCWGLIPSTLGAEPVETSVEIPGLSGQGMIAVGLAAICGLDPTLGIPYCLGWNGSGQLGIPRGGTSPQLLATSERFGHLAVGDYAGCALTPDGAARCWGGPPVNGCGRFETRLSPTPVKTQERFITLAVGLIHACAVTDQAETYCWGVNAGGNLGNRTVSFTLDPVRIDLDPGLVAIAAGLEHSCGLDAAGQAWCWGGNGAGQLGDGTTTQRLVATAVSSPEPFASLTAGSSHTCGLDVDGQAWCWGANSSVQLGVEDRDDRLVPTRVVGSIRFARLSAGSTHTCGLDVDGRAWCWGASECGEIGSSAGEAPRPALVETDLRFVDLVAGGLLTCGIDTTGTAHCWGCNENGQLGDGTQTRRPRPTPVLSPRSFVRLSVSLRGGVACGLDDLSRGWCWGISEYGALGTGDAYLSPVEVSPPDASR